MSTNRFAIFMNIMRVVTLIGVFLLILIMVRNIEEVKTIANPCTMCTQRTGAVCMMRQGQKNTPGLDLSNLNISFEP